MACVSGMPAFGGLLAVTPVLRVADKRLLNQFA